MTLLTIVIPVQNELSSGYIQKQINLFKKLNCVEIIFVDGKSSDGTIELLTQSGFPPIILENSNRAERMNLGIENASSNLILLNHPRNLLNEHGIRYLIDQQEHLNWGGFTHSFDQSHPILKFTSWYSNEVRAKIRGIYYLDHCIFFKKSLITERPIIPELPIFEDTVFSKSLKKISTPTLLPYISLTSSVRFKTNGIIFQSVLNQFMKICWYIGLSPEQMNRVYEKGLELNANKKL